MFKKIAMAAPLTVLMFGSIAVQAKDDASSTINITADIPTKQFHAQPRDPNFGKDETMSFNTVTGELSTLRATYDLKNTDGSIEAYLDGDVALYSGSSSIPLTISLNGVTLGTTPVEVAADAPSTPGMQADLVITAAKPADGQSGLFTAKPVVMFDAVPR
ncbi:MULTISPECIES: CS1 type fimbrial major subunit [unclassified Pseudomonas]|uniref:CS1 type fimbrial major subunit n=1 Tax=unclassified Pseudomonas TaxID=196821 RepID=UPI002AC8DD73|nr:MULTISPECIES: CS1 type fimbrial major subunit [unclassified Pseudomonas]MEB0044982.1 CS1 type fimbrial major subunit [Pseudomonas sp. Dout3]MEB0096006.1 CS1 type fimbrial major subunit [Pseudomonas sp. DC1.2]WPX57870.1 CS1 type fimbrial major subunit [Pseudomonas sp. DC1.2]